MIGATLLFLILSLNRNKTGLIIFVSLIAIEVVSIAALDGIESNISEG